MLLHVWPHISPPSLYASLQGGLPMFVSHRSRLVAVYMTKLDSWRVHMLGCVGRDLDVVPCWWSLYLCVGFFLWRRCCVSSTPGGGGGGGRLFLSLFWCDCSVIFLGHLRFSAMCHAAGYLSGVPHLADSGWLPSSCSGGFAWGWGCLATVVLFSTLVFYLVPALLPLRGSEPLTGASACLTPVC